MAIDDNTSYELTGAQVKDLANKIKAKAADNIFVGATSAIPGSKGLVPQPQAGDDTKFLSGDGTWKTVSSGGNAIKYYIGSDAGTIVTFYKDSGLTTAATYQEVIDALAAGEVRIYSTKTNSGTTTDTIYVTGSYSVVNNNGGYTISLATLNDRSYSYRQFSSYSGISNLNANAVFNNSIRFFTQDMVGATSSTNGRKGYVPQPRIADKDKFLKGDGTWTAVSSGSSYTAGNHIDITNDVISAEGYVWADAPTAATTPAGSITNGMIANSTLTASKFASGELLTLTLSTTDIGEGAPLATNTLYGVYE